MKEKAAIWRSDLDALSFAVFSDHRNHGAACFMHRRAFRALIGSDPAGTECLVYYEAHISAFQSAAWAKIDRLSIPHERSLNLNSRDIRRALGELTSDDALGAGGHCYVLSGNNE